MSLNIYLYFDGRCQEAFDYYKSVFGGEFDVVQKFGDGPPDMNVPPADKDRIMHVSLAVGDTVLMGSDTPSAVPLSVGDNFSVSYAPPSRPEADRVFNALMEGGSIAMPMEDMFWGAYFGRGTDKFGINWQVNFFAPES